MASLTRRLQVLLDDARYRHLERLAHRRGVTVAALVRQALDRAYPPEGLPAAEAANRFLDRPPLQLGSWEDAKREIEDGLARGTR